MTSGRRPEDEVKTGHAAAPSDEQVERAAASTEPRGGSSGAKVTDSVTKAPIDAENADAESVEADLDALLADVKRERDEYLELARRTKADFENYRKRAAKDAQEAERRGKAALARALVPAIDNLERALRAAGIDPDAQAKAAGAPVDADAPSEEVSAHEALARGVALVYGELRATLERAGVESYDPVGERFDPAWHEALSTRPADGQEAGVVVETLERGYRLDGQVLRPARVVVSA
jgi:molecular chaperone GrpE